jgi:hypothetical protein
LKIAQKEKLKLKEDNSFDFPCFRMDEFGIKIGQNKKYSRNIRKLIKTVTSDNESMFGFYRLFYRMKNFTLA